VDIPFKVYRLPSICEAIEYLCILKNKEWVGFILTQSGEVELVKFHDRRQLVILVNQFLHFLLELVDSHHQILNNKLTLKYRRNKGILGFKCSKKYV
jgi:hypothetical protein